LKFEHRQARPSGIPPGKVSAARVNLYRNLCFTLAQMFTNLPVMRARLPIPRSVAQLTGVLVTGIVAFGADLEVYYAVPLGVFAGAVAIFCVSISEAQNTYRARWRDH
jgi:hypothetical protein